MSYTFYKVLHVTGFVAVFMGLGAMLLQAMEKGSPKFASRKWVMLFHGFGMALVLISGFGLMARLGMANASWPAWIYGKVTIWLVAGGISALILRFAKFSRVLWFVVVALAGTAAFLANAKY